METGTVTENRKITRGDIMDMAEYGATRKERRRLLIARKKMRRVAIGPDATAHFEDYDSMWAQVHEMLYIEKGGEAQIDDEIAAYNPLIPNGRELVCTVFFEIDDPDRRAAFLAGLGGVEETMFIRLGGEEITGRPEEDVDRTNADGKASSIQFLHFPFTEAQIEKFRDSETTVTLGIGHDQYGHMANLSGAVREALASDFD